MELMTKDFIITYLFFLQICHLLLRLMKWVQALKIARSKLSFRCLQSKVEKLKFLLEVVPLPGFWAHSQNNPVWKITTPIHRTICCKNRGPDRHQGCQTYQKMNNRYSYLPNKRAGPNKRAAWTNFENQITMQAGITHNDETWSN